MPCDSWIAPEQTEEERRREIDEALRDLEKRLQQSKVKLDIGPSGAAVFTGWGKAERKGITDVCALRTLKQRNSWELRRALQRAEQQSGRKLNMAAVNAGIHSHDGGKTWHPGH